jgi:hydroxymethylglutaryl-CoA synthase
MQNIGIDSFSIAIPSLYLSIDSLAEARNIDPKKLNLGLGLYKMSIPDIFQDVITLAADALCELIQKENLNPTEISRIYVGSECGVDSSKPIGSFLLQLMEQKLGAGTFRHCDTVDFTFACIGGVDALQNCLDYIRLNPQEKAIVITTDIAKYDLNSTGEYTQGAGAIAMLVTENPRLLTVNPTFSVSTDGVFDFFKPRRTTATALLDDPDFIQKNNLTETELHIYKDQPVFDGQYSNQCYIDRIKEAYQSFKNKCQNTENFNKNLYENWFAINMHLPYAFQGRRTFVEIVAQENPMLFHEQTGANDKEKTKSLAGTAFYKNLIAQKIQPSEIASGEVGNIYTGSIFLGLASTLTQFLNENKTISGQKMGFIAYGSGSKSKVFEGIVSSDWKQQTAKIQLNEKLQQRTEIDFETYEKIHTKSLKTNILEPNNQFYLKKIETEIPHLLGARYYDFQ